MLDPITLNNNKTSQMRSITSLLTLALLAVAYVSGKHGVVRNMVTNGLPSSVPSAYGQDQPHNYAEMRRRAEIEADVEHYA